MAEILGQQASTGEAGRVQLQRWKRSGKRLFKWTRYRGSLAQRVKNATESNSYGLCVLRSFLKTGFCCIFLKDRQAFVKPRSKRGTSSLVKPSVRLEHEGTKDGEVVDLLFVSLLLEHGCSGFDFHLEFVVLAALVEDLLGSAFVACVVCVGRRDIATKWALFNPDDLVIWMASIQGLSDILLSAVS